VVGFEVGITAKKKGDEYDFNADTVGDANIRGISEECEEAPEETNQSVKFVKTPKVLPAEDDLVYNGRSQDDKETKEEHVSCLFESHFASKAYDGEEEEKRTQKKEKRMGKLKKKKEKGVFYKESKGTFYRQSTDDKSKKSKNEQREGKRRLFNTPDEFLKKFLHMGLF